MLVVLLGVYLTLSIVAFAAYGWDKRAARKSRDRTPESTLHLLSLAGGWPGALVGQRVWRHKSRKTSFLIVFWLTVVFNCAALAGVLVYGPR